MSLAHAALEGRIHDLEESVNGNGKPGLKTDVAVVQEQMKGLPEINARLSRLEKVAYAGMGALGVLEVALKLIHL